MMRLFQHSVGAAPGTPAGEPRPASAEGASVQFAKALGVALRRALSTGQSPEPGASEPGASEPGASDLLRGASIAPGSSEEGAHATAAGGSVAGDPVPAASPTSASPPAAASLPASSNRAASAGQPRAEPAARSAPARSAEPKKGGAARGRDAIGGRSAPDAPTSAPDLIAPAGNQGRASGARPSGGPQPAEAVSPGQGSAGPEEETERGPRSAGEMSRVPPEPGSTPGTDRSRASDVAASTEAGHPTSPRPPAVPEANARAASRSPAERASPETPAAPPAVSLRGAAPAPAERVATHAALARGTMPLPGAPARFTPAALGEGGPAGDSPRRAREEEKAVKVPEGAAPGTATSLAQALVARPESMPPPAPFEPRATAALSPAAEAALPAAQPGQAGQVDGALLRSAAHLRVETPALGELELHLRIREGTAHLRVEGEGARHLEAQAGDLSRSLAGEGLKLGRLELSAPPAAPDTDRAGAGSPDARREGTGGNRHSFEEPPPPPPSRPPPAPGRPGAHTGGRIHVKA